MFPRKAGRPHYYLSKMAAGILFQCLTLVAVFQSLLELGSCSEGPLSTVTGKGAALSLFESYVRNRRSSGDQCCTLDALDQLQNGIQEDVDLLTQTVFEISFNLQEFIHLGQQEKYPADSCKDLCYMKPGSPSGYYWLHGPKAISDAHPAKMYCAMKMDVPIFGTTQGWMRVANLDLSDPYQECPSGFHLIDKQGKRLCAKDAKKGCQSIKFPSHYVEYQRVCGRVRGFQVGTNNPFHRFKCDHCTINDPYLDGVSVTYGHPRKHIWSLGAAWTGYRDEDYRAVCPCAKGQGTPPPKFVGDNYFCESGKSWDGKIDVDDPLWDGEGCSSDEEKCCQASGLPWFCTDLPKATSEDIEVRVCADQDTGDEDLYLELIQIYVQ